MMRILIGLAVGAIAISACGGATAPSVQAAATTAPVAAATATGSTTAAATASGPNINDVLKAGKNSTYKVSYKWSITAGGQTQTSEQTWFYKAPNSRFDFSAGPGATFSVFSLADGTYVCTNAGGPGFCQKSPAGTALQSNPAADFGLQLQSNPDQFNSSFTGTKSIAGQQAQCYAVKSVAASPFGDVNSCYTSTGVPLLTTMTAQGQTFAMEATSFSATVADSDFTLPAAVR